MYWANSPHLPCFVNEYCGDDRIYTVTDKAGSHYVMASTPSWSLLAAHNIAKAYRPEGLP